MSGDWRGTLWTLLVTFCIVITRNTETFWSRCTNTHRHSDGRKGQRFLSMWCDLQSSNNCPRNCYVRSSKISWTYLIEFWLRQNAKTGNVASSIPDGVIGIFYSHYPSERTVVLSATQPLTEMSTRNVFLGGRGGVNTAGAVKLTTFMCIKFWEP
jgi:hypothetical protein